MPSLIVVPLDGSALSDRILIMVRRLLARRDHEIALLRVVEPTWDAAGAVNELQEARDHLEAARDALARLGATASVHVVASADVAGQIVATAGGLGASMVCMSTHGRSGLRRVVRGSVAEQVLRRCPLPLFLATPAAHEVEGELALGRLLVPLDLTDASRAVLPAAEDLARTYGAEVLLLHVASPQTTPTARPTPSDVTASLEPERSRLAAAGIQAKSLGALARDVAGEILAVAERERVDVLAMSTHGRTGVARAVFGSVAEEVLRQCTRPLLVVNATRAVDAG